MQKPGIMPSLQSFRSTLDKHIFINLYFISVY